MRLLIDTHVWIWMVSAPERLGPRAVEAFEQADVVYFSAASSWEIAIKHALGKLDLPDPRTYVPAKSLDLGVRCIDIDHSHALAVGALPHHHGDPFDRLLIVQAQLLDAPIMTVDTVFDAYGVATIDARA